MDRNRIISNTLVLINNEKENIIILAKKEPMVLYPDFQKRINELSTTPFKTGINQRNIEKYKEKLLTIAIAANGLLTLGIMPPSGLQTQVVGIRNLIDSTVKKIDLLIALLKL